MVDKVLNPKDSELYYYCRPNPTERSEASPTKYFLYSTRWADIYNTIQIFLGVLKKVRENLPGGGVNEADT
jgi:hypothetical protein